MTCYQGHPLWKLCGDQKTDRRTDKGNVGDQSYRSGKAKTESIHMHNIRGQVENSRWS